MILINGKEVEPTIFPDGTSQMWKFGEDFGEEAIIEWWWGMNEAEVFWILQLQDFFRLIPLKDRTPTHLKIPYLPYARQHGLFLPGQCFSGRTFRRFVFPRFDKITTFDVHDPLLIFQEDSHKIFNIMPDLTFANDYDCIVFPDIGARERYRDCGIDTEKVVTAEKTRDARTGEIREIAIYTNIDKMNEARIIIIDDICDGGKTFIELAKVIKEVSRPIIIDLYVSHGIFSNGFDGLYSHFNRIITTDTYRRWAYRNPKKLHQTYKKLIAEEKLIIKEINL